jgi:NAD(P)H-hydrate epimerase
MPGAAALASNAAIRIGAGLVYLMSTSIHPSLKPEIIPTILPADKNGFISYSAKEIILEASLKADVIVFGPGLGDTEEINQLLKELITEIPVDLPLILDADALKSLKPDSKLRPNILLTPHLGEFANLINQPREEIISNHYKYAQIWAEKLNCTILLKHIPTIITNGDYSIWNTGGNSGMATAGSGDVLSGIIAGLIAQGLDTMDAAAIGAFLHSAAGDSYAQKFNDYSLIATDIINELENVLTNLK